MPNTIYLLIPILFLASWWDWKKRIIPNTLLLPTFFLAIVLNILSIGLDGLILSLSGSIAGFALLFIPFLLGGIGAGDVKLLVVIGSCGGIHLVIYGFIIGALIGGFIAICLYLCKHASGIVIVSIPYGIPLSLGTLSWIIITYWG